MHRGDELVVVADGRCISQDLFERLVSTSSQCALVNTWSCHVNFNHCQLLEPREMFKTSVI